jgi:hypothetical protein
MNSLEKLWSDAKVCFDAGATAAENDWHRMEEELEETPLPYEDDPLFLRLKETYPEHFEWLELTWSSGYMEKHRTLLEISNSDTRKLSKAELNKLKDICYQLGQEAATADWEVDALEEFPTPHSSPSMFEFEHQYTHQFSVLCEYWREGYYAREDELTAQQDTPSSQECPQ